MGRRLTGLDVDEVLAANIAKLQERYSAGFDPERSQRRAEEERKGA